MQPTPATPASTSISSTDSNPSATTEWLFVGIVRRAHGVRGELAIAVDDPDALWSDDVKTVRLSRTAAKSSLPSATSARSTSSAPVSATLLGTVQRMRAVPDGVLLQLKEITDRDVAQSWSGAHVEVRIQDLPPMDDGEAFVIELQNATAVDAATDQVIGRVKALSSNGAQPLLVLATPTGERLFPLVDATFAGFDRQRQIVQLHLIPGLWDEPENEAESDPAK